MAENRLARLTEAQREVLRLWSMRRSAKEIGRDLGITHWAVNERLRSARRVLGVASSGEAARQLAEAESAAEPWAEAGGAYNRLVYDPPAIAEDVEEVDFSSPDMAGMRDFSVGEERVPYGSTEPPSLWRLPLPRFRGERNDLSTMMRLVWIGLLALGVVTVVATLVLLAAGVVRMVAEIRHALA
jgi:DNA-binding CsgD family transcriptional regulator